MRLRERRLRCDTVETGGCPDAAVVISADIGLRRSVIGTTTTFRIGDLEQSAARGTVLYAFSWIWGWCDSCTILLWPDVLYKCWFHLDRHLTSCLRLCAVKDRYKHPKNEWQSPGTDPCSADPDSGNRLPCSCSSICVHQSMVTIPDIKWLGRR
jgi:hypothetical protein